MTETTTTTADPVAQLEAERDRALADLTRGLDKLRPVLAAACAARAAWERRRWAAVVEARIRGEGDLAARLEHLKPPPGPRGNTYRDRAGVRELAVGAINEACAASGSSEDRTGWHVCRALAASLGPKDRPALHLRHREAEKALRGAPRGSTPIDVAALGERAIAHALEQDAAEGKGDLLP